MTPRKDCSAAAGQRWTISTDVGLQDLPVSYRVAAELARNALASIPGSRGQYLARGVTVASFVPMRAIPFRVVFVLGLGQGDFPRSARRGDLDLREARREPGDVTPREQDLYMFLETLLCARDRLVLSYLGRDEITGEERPPSAGGARTARDPVERLPCGWRGGEGCSMVRSRRCVATPTSIVWTPCHSRAPNMRPGAWAIPCARRCQQEQPLRLASTIFAFRFPRPLFPRWRPACHCLRAWQPSRAKKPAS
jgi:hypothetical protein